MKKNKLLLSNIVSLILGAVVTFIVVKNTGGKSSGTDNSANGGTQTLTIDGANMSKGGSSTGNLSAETINPFHLEQAGYQDGLNDPKGALDKANSIPGRDNRLAYLQSVFTAWGEKDGAAAADWVEANLKGMDKSDALFNIADGWAEKDPEAAALWFDANTNGTTREDAVWEILEAWGRKSPVKALAWADNLDAFTRSGVMDALAEGWAAKDPAAAAAAGKDLLQYDFGDEFLMNVAGQWASSDPKSAAAWANTLDSPDLRAVTHMEVGTEWGMSDPRAATSWIQSLPNEEDRSYAALGTALGWSEHDPGAALEWSVSAIDDEDTRQRVVEDVMLNWSTNDPNSAAKWLNDQPKGERHDEVLSTFSTAIIDIDPESAVTWAATISDPAQKTEHLTMLLDEWVAMDGKFARDWIRNSNLDEGLKTQFGGKKK